ncbi:HEPN domain protein [Candidatus Vecturithrix granuli]|uniref:HEPN domain protein n=1 Tax=Vecturithrix granuli TaxID=1499967 RepID=A0A081BW86_VECG1|nr:HEPN domain protein [Candidatus Vecturithrix granuli]
MYRIPLPNFPKTHDLSKLLQLLPSSETLDIDEETLLKINELDIDSRYPGEFGLLPYGKPTLADAREFYQFAQEIYTTVCTRLTGSAEDTNG